VERDCAGGCKVAIARVVGPLAYLGAFHDLRDKEVEIRVPLAVRVRNHVYRGAIHGDGDIGPMIGVEASEEDLLGLAAPAMLRDHQPRGEPEKILRGGPGP
jgi:hypothetical protein